MRARAEVVLFAGPTLDARARALATGCTLRRPVRRGDVERLVATRRAPGVLAIVDGVFHDTLAVGHAEIRDAIARGWQVWGLSSMGAIRAREMTPFGMRGFGRVFARFQADGDFQDDEVALLHEPSPPWRAVSEPLVHVRAAADHLIARRLLTTAAAREAIAELKSRWYGERTLRAATEALARGAGRRAEDVRDALREFDRFRIKTIDLSEFLESRAWSQTGLTPRPEMRTTLP